jgi:hypothetical protein
MNAIAQVLWQSPALAPTAVALAAVVAAAVLWLYPPQTREMPDGWRWLLPALRAAAAGALTLAVVQPVVLRPRTTSREGALVLLVDASKSMGVADRQRTPAELVGLASGLGALAPNARHEAAPGLAEQLEAIRTLSDQMDRSRSEADYATLSGRGATAAGARFREGRSRLADAVAQLAPPPASSPELQQRIAAIKQLPAVGNPSGGASIRTEIDAALRAIYTAQAQADAQLFKQNADVRALCSQLGQQSRQQLIEYGLSDDQHGLLRTLPSGVPLYGFTFSDEPRPISLTSQKVSIDSAGSRSDIAGAVRAALQRMGSRQVQAIVLMSDGRQVGGDVEGIAGDVAAAGVPVFAISAASQTPARDVSVVSIDAPAAARVGETITVRAHLHGQAVRGAIVDVRLDAGNVRQVKRVIFGDEPAVVAEFDVTVTSAGPQNLVVNAWPIEGEISNDNNRLERWIRVGAEPVRVTVIVGTEAGKQFASLHEALSRTEWIALRELDEETVTTLTSRAILGQDVVILCNVPVDALDRAQWEALQQLTRRRGGSVIVCAGGNAPGDYESEPAAASLLPMSGDLRGAWRTWPGGAAQFRIVPPSSETGVEADAWRQLPAVSRYLEIPPLGADARALLIERGSGIAVVTEARRALGKIYFVGTDESWRWRGQPGERELFWPRLVRLAAGAPYAAVETNLWLDADDVAPEPNQSFSVSAKVRDVYGDPLDAAAQALHIYRGTELVRDLTMPSLGEGSGRFATSVSGLPQGEYVLRLDAPEDPSSEIPPDPVQLKIHVEPRYAAELADLSGDDRLLRHIADASGGQFLTLDQLDTLGPRLQANRAKQSRLVEYALWDSPYLFGFVLACLSMEWSLRKKFGLA